MAALKANGESFEKAQDPVGIHPGIQFFTRFPPERIKPFRADARLDIRRLRWEDRAEILLGAIHFYDRRNYDTKDQAELAPGVYSTLHEAEVDAEHIRTVVFGDFNMNPFDSGMINYLTSFGAMSTRTLAARHTDLGSFRGPKRFYNPSWTRLGRELPEPPGTHYWRNVSKPGNLFWHHLDQVLIRPTLFPIFRDEDFQIITTLRGPDGTEIDLIRSTEKHWELKYSDHLPIMFRLDMTKLGPSTKENVDA